MTAQCSAVLVWSEYEIPCDGDHRPDDYHRNAEALGGLITWTADISTARSYA